MVTDAMIAAARNKFIAVSHESYFPSNDQIRCVLEAALSVIHGEYSIVPKDPDGEMLEAGKKAWRKPRLHISHQASDDLNTCGVSYRAMIREGEIK